MVVVAGGQFAGPVCVWICWDQSRNRDTFICCFNSWTVRDLKWKFFRIFSCIFSDFRGVFECVFVFRNSVHN